MNGDGRTSLDRAGRVLAAVPFLEMVGCGRSNRYIAGLKERRKKKSEGTRKQRGVTGACFNLEAPHVGHMRKYM